MRKSRMIKAVLMHATLILISTFALFPFVWMLLTSFKTNVEVYTFPVIWIPESLSLESYARLLDINFHRFFLNSVQIAVSVMLAVVLLSILASYGFSRFKFAGKSLLFSSSLMGQLLPVSVMFMPLFMFLGRFFMDSYIALFIVYVAILLPLPIWMLTAYFKGISKSLDEAAMIDGCNKLQLLFHILIPPAMPGIVSVALFAFIVSWQEFLFALIFINSVSKRTLPLALVAFRGQFDIDWASMMAASLVTTLPLAIFFVIMQRRLVAGLTGGAVKE